MENKEIEQELKKKVENVEVRDFSLVWKDIEERVSPKKSANNRRLMRWIASAAALVCLTVACSILLPRFIDQNNGTPEKTYFMDDLGSFSLDETQFYQGLMAGNINHVDFSRYISSCYALFQTEDHQTKGGSIQLTDNIDNPTFILCVQFYDDKVKEQSSEANKYDLNCEANGVTVYYRVKEAYPEESYYVYQMKANYNSVNYYMEYTCFTEDIQPFLTEFFK